MRHKISLYLNHNGQFTKLTSDVPWRKYTDFQSRMSYNEEGTVDDLGPYFVVEKFPFIIHKEDSVDNYLAVLRVMNSTANKLEKDETWRKAYVTKLRD